MRLIFLLVAVGLMALAACGDNYDTYLNRGGDHLDEGEYDAAIDDYNEAIRLNPDRVEAYYNRGLAYVDKGDHNSAITDFNIAIELDPNNTEAEEALELAEKELE